MRFDRLCFGSYSYWLLMISGHNFIGFFVLSECWICNLKCNFTVISFCAILEN